MFGIVTPGSAIYRCCHGTERLAEMVCAVRCLKNKGTYKTKKLLDLDGIVLIL